MKQGRAKDTRSKRGETRWDCFGFLEMLREKVSKSGTAVNSEESQRKGGLEESTAFAPLVTSLMGSLKV